jgi:hypothetical protein
LLAPVYGWFTEGLDTKDLQEAKALLDELADRQIALFRSIILPGSPCGRRALESIPGWVRGLADLSS